MGNIGEITWIQKFGFEYLVAIVFEIGQKSESTPSHTFHFDEKPFAISSNAQIILPTPWYG